MEPIYYNDERYQAESDEVSFPCMYVPRCVCNVKFDNAMIMFRLFYSCDFSQERKRKVMFCCVSNVFDENEILCVNWNTRDIQKFCKQFCMFVNKLNFRPFTCYKVLNENFFVLERITIKFNQFLVYFKTALISKFLVWGTKKVFQIYHGLFVFECSCNFFQLFL